MDHLAAMGITRWVTRPAPDAVVPVALSAEGETSWAALAEAVKQCRACALCETRTQTVFGVGHTQADLLIVGEAPGYYEDQQGEPFVGRAGQLLNAMLKAFQLKREDVYIANVLKCRPPNNRDPQIEEVMQCTRFLEQQVNLLQPKLILAVGRHAAHYLLDSTLSLAKLRQSRHQFRETQIPLLVSYHPAYLLRNPRDKVKAYQDWQQVAACLRGNS